jgi:hypothetical protein
VGRPAKKRAAEDPVAVACSTVVAALGDSNLPPSVVSLLKKMVPCSLGVVKASRDAKQEEVVKMVGEALNEIKALKAAAISELLGKVNNAPQEKVARDEAVVKAQSNVVTLGAAVDDAKQKNADAIAEVKSQKAALKEKEATLTKGDEVTKTTDEKKGTLEKTAAEAFDILKEQGQAAKRAGAKCTVLEKVGKSCGFDQTLVSSIGFALKKDPSKRSKVDAFLIEQLQAELNDNLQNVNQALAKGEQAHAECSDAVVTAKAVLVEKTNAEAASNTALKAALAAEKESRKALAHASEKQANYLSDMKDLMDSLDASKAELSELEAGALEAYAVLQELAATDPELEVGAEGDEQVQGSAAAAELAPAEPAA